MPSGVLKSVWIFKPDSNAHAPDTGMKQSCDTSEVKTVAEGADLSSTPRMHHATKHITGRCRQRASSF